MKKKIETILYIALLCFSLQARADDFPPTDDPPLDDDLPPTDDPPIGAPIDEGIALLSIAGLLFAGKMYHDRHKNRLYNNDSTA